MAQHSHPDQIAPQLAIAQSLADYGTTTNLSGNTNLGAPFIAPLSQAMSGSTSEPTTSRPEGDARERSGRFSRAAWDGATPTLPDYLYSDATPRILTTPRASAYIKIAEGCDHPCTFCIIPQLRGKFRSRPMASILAEAQQPHRPGRA